MLIIGILALILGLVFKITYTERLVVLLLTGMVLSLELMNINFVEMLQQISGEFEEKLQTKKYTRSAIRRAILYILLGIKKSDLDAAPQYTILLGASVKGREYLSEIRKNDNELKVITKPANAEGTRQFELSKKADALYTMCFENKKESGFYIKKSPIIF